MTSYLQRLFQSSPLLMAGLDESLTCRVLSDAWRGCLGLTQSAAVSMPVADLFLPNSGPNVLDQIEQVVRHNRAIRGVAVSYSAGGCMSHGFLSAWPVRQEPRAQPWAVLMVTDTADLEQVLQQGHTPAQAHQAVYQQIKQRNEQLEWERDYLRDEIHATLNPGQMIGPSRGLKRTLARVEAVAQTPASVLILGEPGVGKKTVAHAIHTQSGRSNKPWVKVNCVSVPGELVESEFFGHVRGAFAGAHRDRTGWLQLANEGTLFLDHIGEIPLFFQNKLLRALQQQEIKRIGDDHTLKVNPRIVAATHRNLEAEVKAGRFSEDLYDRLSIFMIKVPPLRDRTDDIVPLATHYLDRFCRDLGRGPLRLTGQQAASLKHHPWPGNIRELKNVMEQAVMLTEGDRLRIHLATSPGARQPEPVAVRPPSKHSAVLTDVQFRIREKENMIAALQAARWRISGARGAADLLGLKPSTLSYRMKALGVPKKP